VVPGAIVNQPQIKVAVQEAVDGLAPEVLRIRYSLGMDSTGLESIFFRVLLSDQASREDRLYETTQRIRTKILNIVNPVEKFGMEAYFNFRSASEQAQLRDLAWE
jgi:hypothetical protein